MASSDPLDGRGAPSAVAEVGGEHLDAVVPLGDLPQPVGAAGDEHLRDAGLAEQAGHRLADPRRGAGDQRRRERIASHPRTLPLPTFPLFFVSLVAYLVYVTSSRERVGTTVHQ